MKPKGWAKFDLLARKLVNVPKEIVNEKIDKEKAARKKRKKWEYKFRLRRGSPRSFAEQNKTRGLKGF